MEELSDTELRAIEERGAEARDILEDRESRRHREAFALEPLFLGYIAAGSSLFQWYSDADGSTHLAYAEIPVSTLLATHPIPKDAKCTPADVRAVLRLWDEYCCDHQSEAR